MCFFLLAFCRNRLFQNQEFYYWIMIFCTCFMYFFWVAKQFLIFSNHNFLGAPPGNQKNTMSSAKCPDFFPALLSRRPDFYPIWLFPQNIFSPNDCIQIWFQFTIPTQSYRPKFTGFRPAPLLLVADTYLSAPAAAAIADVLRANTSLRDLNVASLPHHFIEHTKPPQSTSERHRMDIIRAMCKCMYLRLIDCHGPVNFQKKKMEVTPRTDETLWEFVGFF